MSTESQSFTFSNGETEVRTYACTTLKKLFSPATVGYLTVTNKRVVYHCIGQSMSGSSALLSEMPLEDVAGISSMVGISLNWIALILTLILMYFFVPVLIQLLPSFLTGWFMTFILMVPFAIYWLFEKNILNRDLQEQFMENTGIKKIQQGWLSQKSINFKGIFRVLLFIGLVLLAWNIAYHTDFGRYVRVVSDLLMLAVYFLIYMIVFGRRRFFSLMISSKTAQGSGIYIPGDAFSQIWGRNSTALQSLNAGPAADAETIVRELGALLTDIRLMGDLGIQKWQAH